MLHQYPLKAIPLLCCDLVSDMQKLTKMQIVLRIFLIMLECRNERLYIIAVRFLTNKISHIDGEEITGIQENGNRVHVHTICIHEK